VKKQGKNGKRAELVFSAGTTEVVEGYSKEHHCKAGRM
jgi:hypothetical protein